MNTELQTIIGSSVQQLFDQQVDIELTRPDEQFGDYATNVAMQLAKPLQKNPREVADALAAHLHGSSDLIDSVTVAGPGFLNIRVSQKAILEALKSTPAQHLHGQTIVAEYSDPNPFKVLHAGHLYTTIVGNAVANLLATAGGSVHRVNFGGDVGLHVGKTMWGILHYAGEGQLDEARAHDYINVLATKTLSDRATAMAARYVEGNNAYDDDETAKAQIVDLNKRVYELHANNDTSSDFAAVYWAGRKWSYEYFEQFYEQLGVTAFEKYYPESQTAQLGLETVKQQLTNGVYQESDGAVVFHGEPFGLHTRVFINSQGLPTYEAKDVGLIMKKWQDYAFDMSVIITGNDIVEYMKVVLKSIEQFQPELSERTKHVTHGQIKLTGGVKMSSRKGNVLFATDILDAAHDAAAKIGGHDSAQIANAAVKYAFLKQRTGGDIIYDPQESVSLEGNSGPYLQYAHARARSILRKAVVDDQPLGDLDDSERSLVRKLTEFSEVVDRAAKELMPHHVCTYLYELAQAFNRFYEHNRVIDDPRQAERLRIVNTYADTLKRGLDLLGIYAPEQM